MTFTSEEAEQILREEWDDATSVGGFWSSNCRDSCLGELIDQFGEEALLGWRLIGVIPYSDYDEGWTEYLFANREDDNLYSFRQGNSCYGGSFGENFSEISRTDMQTWLETLANVTKHNETFVGC